MKEKKRRNKGTALLSDDVFEKFKRMCNRWGNYVVARFQGFLVLTYFNKEGYSPLFSSGFAATYGAAQGPLFFCRYGNRSLAKPIVIVAES
jgi:hypothetical protein